MFKLTKKGAKYLKYIQGIYPSYGGNDGYSNDIRKLEEIRDTGFMEEPDWVTITGCLRHKYIKLVEDV